MIILQTHNLSKNYGRTKALDNLNLTIEKGNVYGLLGPNGSGKTTTLGIILGILSQSSGTYEWFGGAKGDYYRMNIGAILETPNFYPYLNAEDNLRIIAQIKNSDQRNFDKELEMVDLVHRKNTKFQAYSLGMKQRLAIAATMIGDPEVVIFDEPTNGLDPQGIAEVRNILKKVADSGKTVIMASHILSEVEKICSHVCIIKNGKLLVTGPVGEILSQGLKLVEINAQDIDKLRRILEDQSWVESIKEKNGILECMVDENIHATEINKLLFDHGIIAEHLVSRKRKLEEEFLAVTSQN